MHWAKMVKLHARPSFQAVKISCLSSNCKLTFWWVCYSINIVLKILKEKNSLMKWFILLPIKNTNFHNQLEKTLHEKAQRISNRLRIKSTWNCKGPRLTQYFGLPRPRSDLFWVIDALKAIIKYHLWHLVLRSVGTFGVILISPDKMGPVTYH